LSLTPLVLVAGTAAAADRTRPTQPKNLRVTAVTATSVSLAWNPSTDNSGSFSYVVRELNNAQTRTVPQSQTTYTWTGLQPSRTYRFLVFARDGAGNQSGNSNTVTATTPASPPPATPANLRVTGTTLVSVSLAWDASAGATSYQVSREGLIYGMPAPQTSFTVDGLSPGTAYTFMVRASNSAGPSVWSTPLVASTITDSTPPDAPIVQGRALSPGTVELSWTESVDDLSFVSYNVYVNGHPARSMLPSQSELRTVVIHNLRASTTYAFTVKAYDTSGNFSPLSEVFFLTTPAGTDTTPPAAPADLQQLGPTQISSVWLGWHWAADDVGVMAYEVYADGGLVGETLVDVHYNTLDTFFTVRHLPPGSTHTFTVKARDESGNVSEASNPLTVTLLPSSDTEAPAAPFNLTGSTAPGCGFLDFTWNHPGDPSGQLEYEVYEDGLFRGVWRWEAFEASFGRHTYYLKAVDPSGNTSGPSNVIVLDSGLGC
jgi:chitodextrinase